MQRPPALDSDAVLEYLDGDFKIVRPGAYVRCAATGVPIPVDEIRYWNVDRQEAYAGPDVKLLSLGIKR
jgi:hypothetical protein